MSAPVTIACTFDRVNRKKDRSISLSFTSNLEVSTEDLAELDRRLQKSGWLLWAESQLQAEEIPTHEAPTGERKTKGQRLRAVYFLIHRKLQIDEDFDTWFDRQFEKLMSNLKEKLE